MSFDFHTVTDGMTPLQIGVGLKKAYALDDTVTSITPADTDFLTLSENIFDLDSVVNGSYVTSSGSFVSSATWSHTGYQKVEAGKRYYFTTTSAPNEAENFTESLTSYFDINKSPISLGATKAADRSFIVPANAVYIVTSKSLGGYTSTAQLINVESLTDALVFDGTIIPQGYYFTEKVNVPTALLRFNELTQPLINKNWVAMGDSITLQAIYIPPVRSTTGLLTAVNLGVNGQVLRTMADNLTQSMVDAADVITVFGGTNDYGHGAGGIGAMTDASSVNSTYGSVRLLIETIYGLINSSTLTNTEKHSKKVVFVTPLMRGSYVSTPTFIPPVAGSGGKTLLGIRNAIIEVCAEFGIPVFDAYSESGVNQLNIGYTLPDGLHPSAIGCSVFGVRLGKFLNNL
jgi:lysophospholipase L1-like esterase